VNKVLKSSALAAALLIVAITAAACGGAGSAGNTPEGAVKAWFDAAFAGNVEGVKAQTCSAGQAMVTEAVDEFGNSPTPIDASGLTFTKASEEGNSAVVTISGSFKTTVEGQELDLPLDGMTLPLVLENGSWKVCNSL
jgi:hypothetical protein